MKCEKKSIDKYIFLNFRIHEYWIYQGYNTSDILNLDWEIISQSEDEIEVKKKKKEGKWDPNWHRY